MMDFYKKNNGDYLEGFLGDRDKFNGVVFMLKEPNHQQVKKNEEDERFFWFQNFISGKKYYKDDLSEQNKITSKRTASTFKNRFYQMLQVVGLDKEADLNNAVFCNVHPEWGRAVVTDEYKKDIVPNVIYKMEVLVEQCIRKQGRKNLIIFTCSDSYKILKRKYIDEGYLGEGENDLKGLAYIRGKNGEELETKGKIVVDTGEYELTIYEILHPVRNPSISVRESK